MSEKTKKNLLSMLDPILPDLYNIHDSRLYDDIHHIQSGSTSLLIDNTQAEHVLDSEDVIAFNSRFTDEIKKATAINKLVAEGESHIHMLYSFRSVSRAIPMSNITIPDDATEEEKQNISNQKQRYNQAIIDIMRPEIMKLKTLMEYISKANSCFIECFTYILEFKSTGKYIPDILFDSLLAILDVLVRIDNIKDQKTCLNNDFARYKRALGALSTHGGMFLSANTIEEQQEIQNFLSSQDFRKAKNYIVVTLRDELKNILGNEDLLMMILDSAVESFENQQQLMVFPDRKFQILRCLPYLLYLADGNLEDAKSFNVFKNKKSISAVQKIIKDYPIIPLCGDMQMSMSVVLDRAPHFHQVGMGGQWIDSTEGKVPDQYNLTVQWPIFRESFSEYSVTLMSIVNRLITNPFKKEYTEPNVDLAARVYATVEDGLARLGTWNAFIIQVMAWKFSHPKLAAHANTVNNESEQRSMSQSKSVKSSSPNPMTASTSATEKLGIEYERALKDNFTGAELSMFIEIMFIVKALANIFNKHEAILSPILRFHIYLTVQELVQPQLLPVLHRAHKRNKKALLAEVLTIRFLAADRKDRASLMTDFITFSRKLGKADITSLCPLTARIVPCTHTQWQLLRTHIHALYDDKSLATVRQGLFSGKVDLEADDIVTLESFYTKSRNYSYILSLQATVNSASDLSDLWYREFFLEISRCVQFPIELSFPWILFEHIMDRQSKEIPLVECSFYMLEIYNDAAQRALDVLKQQHVFDEIQAEANLFLDQFIFGLSEAVYAHFKEFSASNALEYSFKMKMEELKRKPFLSVGKHLFEPILSQRNVMLLGRSIDLNFLIGQHVNNKLQRDMDAAIQIFEGGDITSLPELRMYIDLLKQTHIRLSKFLSIDPFDAIFSEANESFAPTAFCGRVTIHVLRSLITDIFPNYSYNLHTQRFVPSPVPLRPTPAPRPVSVSMKHLPPSACASTKHAVFGHDLSRAYEATGRRTRGFFSRTHMEAFIALCSTDDVPLLIEQCVEYMVLKVREVHAFYEALSDGILPCKLPKFMYRTGGVYASFEVLLQPLVQYDGLKADVFQCFREIGNVVMFLRDLSDTLAVWSALQYFQCNAVFSMKKSVTRNVLEDFPIDPDSNNEPLSPFGRVMQDFFAQHVGKSSESNSPSVLLETTRKVIESLSSQLQYDVGKKSLLVYALAAIQETLRSFDGQSSLSSNATSMSVSNTETLEIQDPKEFHRFLSALNFIFCMPDDTGFSDEPGRSDLDEYGHGFIVSGCAFLHLLGQKSRYQLLDFSLHILNVHHYEQTVVKQSDAVGSVDSTLQKAANHFVQSAQQHRLLFTELMCLFEATFPIEEPILYEATFHPPASDTSAPTPVYSPGATRTAGLRDDESTSELQVGDVTVSGSVNDSGSAFGYGNPMMQPTAPMTSNGLPEDEDEDEGMSEQSNDEAIPAQNGAAPRRQSLRSVVSSTAMSEFTDVEVSRWTG